MCTQHSGARADESKAKRLATAMSLYSDSLSGVVLTVDNRLSSYTGVKKQFASLCEKVRTHDVIVLVLMSPPLPAAAPTPPVSVPSPSRPTCTFPSWKSS